jgi:16S rRNA (guanine527-N7)-methyltransferase
MFDDDGMEAEDLDRLPTEPSQATLPELFDRWQETLNWQPTLAQQEKLQALYELILEGNRQFNLTRITEPTEFWEKHLWDSLSGIFLSAKLSAELSGELSAELGESRAEMNSDSAFQVIDIGTGAGFPGLPVAIAHPNWQITLLDATRKKIAFLEGLVTALGMENVKTWCDRAEQVGRNSRHRGVYDLTLVRAVAPASVCAEYALPLLKLGGIALLYRGQWTPAEAEPLDLAVEQLGGSLEAVREFKTPLSHSVRHCLYLRKVAATPREFPRSIGVPVQKPL